MPMAARSRIMAIPCIPIRATPRLCRPTARVLQTSGLSPPPRSRHRQPHLLGVRPRHLLGTAIPNSPYARAGSHAKALQRGSGTPSDMRMRRGALGELSVQCDDGGVREGEADLTPHVFLKAVRSMNAERSSQAGQK